MNSLEKMLGVAVGEINAEHPADPVVPFGAPGSSVEPLEPAPSLVNPVDPTSPAVPQLGKLGAEAIQKYCDAAAAHIEEVRTELETLAASVHAELTQTAQSIREIGKLEADRALAATIKMRDAVIAVKVIREKFNGG